MWTGLESWVVLLDEPSSFPNFMEIVWGWRSDPLSSFTYGFLGVLNFSMAVMIFKNLVDFEGLIIKANGTMLGRMSEGIGNNNPIYSIGFKAYSKWRTTMSQNTHNMGHGRLYRKHTYNLYNLHNGVPISSLCRVMTTSHDLNTTGGYAPWSQPCEQTR